MSVPDKTFPANQDSSLDHACLLTLVSDCSAHIGRGGHIPEHYLIHLAEGNLQLICAPHSEGPWPPIVLCLSFHRPTAAWAVPMAHRMVGTRGQAGGSWSPGKVRVQGCSWTTQSSWKCFLKAPLFVFFFKKKNLLYIKKNLQCTNCE